jgi:hypothetical protein
LAAAAPPHPLPNRLPRAATIPVSQACHRRVCGGLRRGICIESSAGQHEEHHMPNRGELAIPARSADFGAQDALMVIAFCAIGWLMSISLAASMLGSGTLPKFPWG